MNEKLDSKTKLVTWDDLFYNNDILLYRSSFFGIVGKFDFFVNDLFLGRATKKKNKWSLNLKNEINISLNYIRKGNILKFSCMYDTNNIIIGWMWKNTINNTVIVFKKNNNEQINMSFAHIHNIINSKKNIDYGNDLIELRKINRNKFKIKYSSQITLKEAIIISSYILIY